MVRNIQTTVTILGRDQLSPVVARATSLANNSLVALNRRASAIASGAFGVSRITAGIGTAIAAPLIYAGKQAVNFEQAMTGLGKVANIDVGTKAFTDLGDQVKDVAVHLGRMPTDIADNMKALKQSGTAVKDLKDLATFSGEAGVALDLTAAKAGEAFGQIRAAMGVTTTEAKNTFDAINQLSNNMGASPERIISFFTAGGASVASSLKIQGNEIGAFGATLIQAGKSGEEAATILERMAKATVGKKAIKAAYVSGGTGTAGLLNVLRKGKSLNPLDKASGKEADRQGAYYQNFGEFGLQVKALSDKMAGPGGLVSALDLVSSKEKYAGAIHAEFTAVQKSTLEQLKRGWAAFQVAVIDFGTAVLPTLKTLAVDTMELMKSVSAWVKANPELTTTLIKAAAAAAAFSFAVSGVSAVIGSVATVVKATTVVIGWFSAGGAMAGVVTSVSAFGSSLWVAAGAATVLGAPLWLVVGAVAAVGAAVYAAYKNFEWFHKLVVTLTVSLQALAAHAGGFFDKLFKGNFKGAFGELSAANQESIINTKAEMERFRNSRTDWKGLPESHFDQIAYQKDAQKRNSANNLTARLQKDVNGNYINNAGTGLNEYGKTDPAYRAYPKDVNTGSSISISNNPIFNVSGPVSADQKKELLNLAAEANHDLAKKIEAVQRNNKRIKFD